MKYLYFIKPVGMDGPIKIGYSQLPTERLLSLSVWSPFVLEMIGTAPGGSREESFLHQRFANLHTHREWFNSSPLLRGTIARILAGETVEAACVEIQKAGSIRNQKRRPPTPERQRFIDYGRKIRKVKYPSTKGGSYYKHPDITKIMDAWQGDYGNRKPVEPTAEQIALIEAFLADPLAHSVFLKHESPRDWRYLDVRLTEALLQRESA